MSNEFVAILQKVLLFSDLPEESLQDLANHAEMQDLEKDEFLFCEGEAGDALFVIVSGSLEIFKGDYRDPKRPILAVLKEGEYLGEMALLEDKPRTASVRAMQTTRLLRLDREDFKRLLEQNTSLAVRMAGVIASRLRMTLESTTPAVQKNEKNLDLSQTRVFISYSRRDKTFVKSLYDAISTAGINTWVDWENIPLTADWWQEIERGIKNADAIAFVISPDSLKSEICQREVQTAIDNNKRLVPVLHRDAPPDVKMPQVISATNWVYMRSDEEMQANMNAMLAVINTDLDWVREHTRLLGRALEWDAGGRNNNLLLRGPDLDAAQAWLAKSGAIAEPKPLPLHGEFIQASRKDAARRMRITRGVGVAFIILLVIATIFSSIGFNNASIAQRTAQANYVAAQTANAEAAISLRAEQTAQVEAQLSLNAAQTAQVEAEQQRNVARTQEALANEQRFLARAGELAALPYSQIEPHLDLAMLLGIEAFRFNDNKDSRASLISSWMQEPMLRQYFYGHEGQVKAVALTEGGRIFTGGEDMRILQWDAGMTLPTGEADTDDIVYSLAWDEARERLAAGLGNGTILVYDGDLNYLETLPGPPGLVLTLDWAGDGRLAAGGSDGVLWIWDETLSTNLAVLEHDDSVYDLAWSPDDRILASTDWSNEVYLWRGDFYSLERWPDHGSGVRSVTWSLEGELTTGGFKDIKIWDVFERSFIRSYEGHGTWVYDLQWSPWQGILASASEDTTIRLWYPNGQSKVLEDHTGWVYALAWNYSNDQLVSVDYDGKVILWQDGSHPALISSPYDTYNWVQDVAWSSDGRLASTTEYEVVLWDTEGRVEGTLEGADNIIYTVDWSPDDSMLATGDDDEKVIIWDAESRQIIKELFGHEHFIRGVIWLANDRLLSFDDEANIILWDVSAGQEIRRVESPTDIERAIVTDDGQLITVGDNQAIIWDAVLEAPEISFTSEFEESLTAVAISPDGELLAAGDDKGRLIIWDVATQQQIKVLKEHAARINRLDWSVDGLLASASNDRKVIVWDLERDVPGYILLGHTDIAKSLAWSKDGIFLASGGHDDKVFRWDLYPETWITQNCVRAGRNLSQAEWRFYFLDEPYHQTCEMYPPGE